MVLNFKKSGPVETERRDQSASSLPEDDEAWKTCHKRMKHPAWLLAYRIVAFVALLSVLIANVVVDGGDIVFYHTQWTFALVTVYFALGSLISICGCCKYCDRSHGDAKIQLDAEQGTCVAHICERSSERLNLPKNLDAPEEHHAHNTSHVRINIFQIVFQRFPLFRIAYFVLWTGIFVIVQWIIHVCVSKRYIGVAAMHIPCYGIFALIIRIKNILPSRSTPSQIGFFVFLGLD